jgi:hypothetical protein
MCCTLAAAAARAAYGTCYILHLLEHRLLWGAHSAPLPWLLSVFAVMIC